MAKDSAEGFQTIFLERTPGSLLKRPRKASKRKQNWNCWEKQLIALENFACLASDSPFFACAYFPLGFLNEAQTEKMTHQKAPKPSKRPASKQVLGRLTKNIYSKKLVVFFFFGGGVQK